MSLIDDLRTLDTKQPGNWPWPIKIGAFVIIFIVIQVGAWFLLWQAQTEEIERGRSEVTKLKDVFLEKKKLAVNLEAYKQQRAEIEQAFGALLKQLPNKSEMDALLIDINQAGLGRGLAFELFKPASSENFTEFYAELPVNIKVTGNYHDLGAFASDVAKMPRIVLLTDLKIDPPKDGVLAMEAVAKTYRYLDEEEVAKQRKSTKDKAAAKAKAGGK
jgi:type IV pilus assembly protein PilO